MANNINITFSKADMGLENVDNTSDLNKPISTDTQTALDDKVDKEAGSRLITSAEATLLGNTSGTNTGDQDLQSVVTVGNTTDTDIQFGDGVGVLLNNTSRLREGTIDSGAGGGVAQICAVGYELKWEAGSQYVMDGNGLLIREVNHKFASIPDANNDNTQGFYVGSRWILDDGSLYICTDSTTAAAVWVLQTIDAVPTDGSVKAVESNGVFDALADKVDKEAGSRLITSAESTLLGNTSGTNTGDQDLSGLVVKNTAITGATKTKITYDTKGLVTSGADATTADIADSTNKRYVTDANLTVIGNTSGTNTGDETVTTIKTKLGITTLSGSNTGDQDLSGYQTTITATTQQTFTDGLTVSPAPLDTMMVQVTDPAASTVKKFSWLNFKTYLLAYFDTIFPRITAATTGSVISFSVPVVWNTPASPSTSNLTDDLTGAKIGYIQKIYHDKAFAPTVPAGWVLIGTGTYTTSTLNIIFAEWVSSTRVEYWITKPA